MANAPEYRFYHLSTTPLIKALGELAGKAVEKGHKILVAAPDDAAAKTLDDGLWTWRQDQFLPHGITGDPAPDKTPVWISANQNEWQSPPNNADTLIITGGMDTLGDYALICDLFDGSNPEELTAARARWQALKDKGIAPGYFQQTDKGGWAQK